MMALYTDGACHNQYVVGRRKGFKRRTAKLQWGFTKRHSLDDTTFSIPPGGKSGFEHGVCYGAQRACEAPKIYALYRTRDPITRKSATRLFRGATPAYLHPDAELSALCPPDALASLD